MRNRNSSRPQPSFEELLSRARDLPEGHRGNILDGALHVAEAPSPARAHALAELSAALVAGSPLGDPVPDGWSFLSNVELAIEPDSLLSADVAGWRMGQGELATAGSPVRLAPAWVCEVIGGGTRAFTLTAKRRRYAEYGVEHLWIVDPEAQVLEVFHNHRGKWLLTEALSEESNVLAAPFGEFHFDVGDLWIPNGPASQAKAPASRRDGPASRRRG
jgi:Uma2 family endonuclease